MDANQPTVSGRPVVAIINTSQETIQLLQEVFADEGIDTVAAYVTDFKWGQRDLSAFYHEHQPQAVVYDIAIPYIENWQFFQEHVLRLGLLPESHYIVTTTNRAVLESLVGPTSAIELIGRPFDLETLVTAVRRSLPPSVR